MGTKDRIGMFVLVAQMSHKINSAIYFCFVNDPVILCIHRMHVLGDYYNHPLISRMAGPLKSIIFILSQYIHVACVVFIIIIMIITNNIVLMLKSVCRTLARL